MSGTRPFFSAIIPSFNRWPIVEEAVKSALEQDYPSFEVIVVDDGSTDGTARALARSCPGARIVRRPNAGPAAARNTGIREARAPWLAFLDSDDLWVPGKLSRIARAINEEPGVRFWHSDETWIRGGRRVNPRPVHHKAGSRGDGGALFRRSLEMCLISPSAAVVHADVFAAAGLFDEAMPACEDYDMWLRAMARFEIGYVPDPLTVKRNGALVEGMAPQLSLSTRAQDVYRVYSIERLLRGFAPGEEMRAAALGTLARKAEIIAEGARKRGRAAEAGRWREKARRARAGAEVIPALPRP